MIELEFDTRREETDSIYLTENEILQLLEIKDFDDAVHEHVRDVFVVGCFTAMRFSDYSMIDSFGFVVITITFISIMILNI